MSPVPPVPRPDDEVIRRLWPEPGVLDDDSLVSAYATNTAMPWLRVNFVSSLDGAVTAPDGYSAGLSGPADKRVFGHLRAACDALMVGAGTLRHERYGSLRLDPGRRRWRLEHGLAEYPTLVIVSRSLDLDPRAEAFTHAPVRPIVITVDGAPPVRREALSAVADVLVHGEVDVDLPEALRSVRERGYGQVLCEGGPHVLAALTGPGLVDELCLTMTPLLIGPGPGRITAGAPIPRPHRLRLHHILAADSVLLLRYTRSPSQHATS